MPARRRRGSAPDTGSVAKKIKSVSSVDEYAKVLAFADNKIGKTTFCGTAPNVLIVDINEEGTRSIRSTNAKVLNIKTWPEFIEAYWFMRETGRKHFETVAVDTVTALESLAMRFTLPDTNNRDPAKQAAMPNQPAWHKVTSLMRAQILAWRNLPMHVIFTAQERREYEGEGEAKELVSIVPAIAPAARGTLLGATGVNGRLYKVKVRAKGRKGSTFERRMIIGEHDVIRSGNRLEGALPNVLRNPDMKTIIEAYKA